MDTQGFPLDDYTPYGYLDVPGHTRKLTPKGVLRTKDAGFCWHHPALGVGYGGRKENYRAWLRVGLDGALELADFDRVAAPYHSKSLVRFELEKGSGRAEAEFFLIGDDVVCAWIAADAGQELTVQAGYSRVIGADQGWGESGLVGRTVGDCVVLQAFEDGEAFALQVTDGPAPLVTSVEAAGGSTLPDGTVTVLGARGESIELHGTVTAAAGEGEYVALLARGRTADEAIERLHQAQREVEVVHAARFAADERFWASAPRLSGDWPAHWRRGLVYDLETLRMMVKPPAGIYRRPWDAMQIQSPRVVLAEAAIDAFLLAYADPELAQELMLGTFADAPLPQVPCSREDGSYNMVSADGSVCGTGPQWGYPWQVIRQLYTLRPDDEWLARLYPHLSVYLDWWLANRRDGEGWLVHACSWESGQDLSPRFGEQPLGGGHPTWQVRPVDLQAAFADAAATMVGFASILSYRHDVARWQQLADEFRERTEQLWNGSRYADQDGRTGAFTEVDDVMLLAPAALGLTPPDRVRHLAAAVRQVDPANVHWPMFAWTAVDAATNAGEPVTAAAIAGSIVERAYGFWDARVHEPDRTMPGVACEYWPLSGRCGGEGYGWGAFTTHLLLGTLIGLRPDGDGLSVCPNLPVELRVPGRRYELRLTLRGLPVEVVLRPMENGVEVAVNGLTAALAWLEEIHWQWDEVAGS